MKTVVKVVKSGVRFNAWDANVINIQVRSRLALGRRHMPMVMPSNRESISRARHIGGLYLCLSMKRQKILLMPLNVLAR